jgi:hypothetical protein
MFLKSIGFGQIGNLNIKPGNSNKNQGNPN